MVMNIDMVIILGKKYPDPLESLLKRKRSHGYFLSHYYSYLKSIFYSNLFDNQFFVLLKVLPGLHTAWRRTQRQDGHDLFFSEQKYLQSGKSPAPISMGYESNLRESGPKQSSYWASSGYRRSGLSWCSGRKDAFPLMAHVDQSYSRSEQFLWVCGKPNWSSLCHDLLKCCLSSRGTASLNARWFCSPGSRSLFCQSTSYQLDTLLALLCYHLNSHRRSWLKRSTKRACYAIRQKEKSQETNPTQKMENSSDVQSLFHPGNHCYYLWLTTYTSYSYQISGNRGHLCLEGADSADQNPKRSHHRFAPHRFDSPDYLGNPNPCSQVLPGIGYQRFETALLPRRLSVYQFPGYDSIHKPFSGKFLSLAHGSPCRYELSEVLSSERTLSPQFYQSKSGSEKVCNAGIFSKFRFCYELLKFHSHSIKYYSLDIAVQKSFFHRQDACAPGSIGVPQPAKTFLNSYNVIPLFESVHSCYTYSQLFKKCNHMEIVK